MTISWPSGRPKTQTGGSFNRLRDSPTGPHASPWRSDAYAGYGGQDMGSDNFDLSAQTDHLPAKGIKVRTGITVTISERLDWQDDLF